MGKGEIARYEACFPGASKDVIVWEWVKGVDLDYWRSTEGLHNSQCYLFFFSFFPHYILGRNIFSTVEKVTCMLQYFMAFAE